MPSAAVFPVAVAILGGGGLLAFEPSARSPVPAATPTALAPFSAADTLHTEASTGVIEGVVRMRPVRQRRTADRYGGGGAAAEIQDIPAMVFVQGAASGGVGRGGAETMGQRDKLFDPSLLVVPVGTVVEFPNHDPIFHNVFSYSSAARFDLGRYPQGESKEVRFDEPGIVKVYCEVHESMRAAVVVVENPHWAQVEEDGRFRIEGVPAGTHTLVAWHTDRREREVEVTVPAGGTARVEVEL